MSLLIYTTPTSSLFRTFNFVARRGEQKCAVVVGRATMIYVKDGENVKPHALLGGVHVEEGESRQEVETALIAAALKLAKGDACEVIAMSNDEPAVQNLFEQRFKFTSCVRALRIDVEE